LTGSQFAQIFRGEINDWSQLGGAPGPIRVIDRPATSETRQALKTYPVFTTAPFETGNNATQLSEDSIEALAQALGADGIGYVLVAQLEGQSAVRALELHKTPPTDPRYPFSQPYSFVYVGGASPAIAAFLGYATGSPGQAILNQADLSSEGAASSASSVSTNPATGAASSNTSADGGANGIGADGTAEGTAANPDAVGTGEPTTADPLEGISANGMDEGSEEARSADTATSVDDLVAGRGRWWWLLLPLSGLSLLILAAGRQGDEEGTSHAIGAAREEDDQIRSAADRNGTDLSETAVGGTDRSGNASESSPNVPPTEGSAETLEPTTAETTQRSDSRLESTGADNPITSSRAAMVGGAAAIGAGLVGRTRSEAGDITMDLNSIPKSPNHSSSSPVPTNPDDLKDSTQASSSNRSSIRSSSEESENWLDRAKQRINEATEQVKSSSADTQDDIAQD
ncbi:MAG: substrate-binding domain-containing protein, partial [Phormidesmis sp.]